MTDVVMRQESSDYTLSVKELDVVLPRYQPFNGPLELYPTSHQQRSPYKPPLHHNHFDGKDFWSPVVKYLHPPDEDELERQMELDKKELDAAAVLPPDNPAPVDGSMSPSFFDFLHPSQIVYRKIPPGLPYSPGPITYSPPTPGGHVPTITYEPRNDALHAVPLPCSKKIGLHCYNLEKGTNFEPSGLPKYLHLPDEDELERQMELDKKELRDAAVLPPDNPAPVDGSMSPSFFDFLHPSRKLPPGPTFYPSPITFSPPTPGGHVPTITYEPRNDALHAVPSKIGLHCYNLEKGTNLHLPDEDELERQMELDKKELGAAAVLPPDNPAPVDGLMSPSYFDYLRRKIPPGPPFSPCPITYSPPPPGGHTPITYEPRNDALHAVPSKIGLHCYNLEKGTNLHLPDEDELERQMELDKKELGAAAVLPPDNPAPVDGLMSPSYFDYLRRKIPPGPPFSPCPITYSPPPPGGHTPITYEPRNDALHAVPSKIGLHCYNLEKGTNLHLPDEDELERQMELDKKELGAAAVLPPDNPAPVDGLMSPSYFDYLRRKIPPGPPFSPCPITYSPPPPGGHTPITYEPRNDALHAVPSKIGLHCYNLEKGTNFEPSGHLHLPDEDELERQMELDKKELGAAAVLPPDNPAPVDGLMSPSFFDFLHPSQIVYRPLCPSYSPRPITYSPPTPGGHVPTITYEPRNDALHAVPLPCSKKIGLHCYNLEKGTNFEPSGLPKVAEDTGVLDTLSVDELFKGNMPDWLPDDTSKLLQYYEMKESEVEQAKEWLHLYAELAWYTKKQTDPLMFEYSKPLELGKVIVQTRGVVDSMNDIKLLDNAVFFISFKTSCGDVCKGIIRRTSDGKPEHLSLEAKCFM